MCADNEIIDGEIRENRILLKKTNFFSEGKIGRGGRDKYFWLARADKRKMKNSFFPIHSTMNTYWWWPPLTRKYQLYTYTPYTRRSPQMLRTILPNTHTHAHTHTLHIHATHAFKIHHWLSDDSNTHVSTHLHARTIPHIPALHTSSTNYKEIKKTTLPACRNHESYINTRQQSTDGVYCNFVFLGARGVDTKTK